MTYVVPDPRTQAFARITAGMCLLLCNSDLAWSVSAANTYAAARGIPAGNIVSLPLGTTQTWDPGANSVLGDFCATLQAARVAKTARAIIIGAGCPARVRVRGVIVPGGFFDPLATGLPPFGHLVMGSPSYNTIISGNVAVTCRELGSGRWVWFAIGGPTPFEIWNARVMWKLGLSDNRGLVNPDFEETGLVPISSQSPGLAFGSLPTPLATTYAGWSGARVIPSGRVGWVAWRMPSVAFGENSSNWDGPLNSSLAADSLTAQPEPILISLQNVTGSLIRWAGFANRMKNDWGYDVEYFYRQSSIPPDVQSLCPVAGAIWSKADFEGGSIVGAPYYVLGGDMTNADDPVREEPFKSSLSPVNGADIVEISPSYAYEWGIRGLQSGAASASMDVTHRTETTTAWVSLWHRLRGMNGLEQQWNQFGSSFYSGDPLHRPFHFDPAGSLTLFEDEPPPLPPVQPPYGDNTANSPYRTWRPRVREPRRLRYRR
jgi:hypothetical protein